MGRVLTSRPDAPPNGSVQFCDHVMLKRDRLSSERFFAAGKNFESFQDYWENHDNYIKEPVDSVEIIYIDARSVEGVYLFQDEAKDPNGFWTRHGSRAGYSQEIIFEKAKNISKVKSKLDAGEKLEDLVDDIEVGACAGSYFENPIKVCQADGFYIFEDDGRHRTIAAQSVDSIIPVRVTSMIRKK